ncbi:MAG: hypothetical protein EBS01_09085 [Verrucomicrobia bacterium]|nr:hypothetical protein [Verrucomicrobiota bacterium]
MLEERSTRALIVGTSTETEILNDKSLVMRLIPKFTIMCINTAFHYFPALDFLFFNGRFTSLGDEDFQPRSIGTIFSPVDMVKVKHYRIFRFHTRQGDFASKISTDITAPLPHGPTTLLDIVFPACAHLGFKEIYILGAEYRKDIEYKRFPEDAAIVNRAQPTMNRQAEMELAHLRLQEWNAYFEATGISCFALSKNSQTPFKKIELESLC